MRETTTATVTIHGVPVSVCSRCGAREPALICEARDDMQRKDADPGLRCYGYRFSTHRNIVLYGGDDGGEWPFCPPCLLVAKSALSILKR